MSLITVKEIGLIVRAVNFLITRWVGGLMDEWLK